MLRRVRSDAEKLSEVERSEARTGARQPYEVAPGVYCLEAGPRFLPSNVYFVRSGTAWVLIDSGWGNCAELIKTTAESLFGAKTRPAAILVTHVHPDHSGSALDLSKMWDLPVHVHPDDMPLTEGRLEALEGFPVGPLDRWIILPVMRAMPRRWREGVLASGRLKDRVRRLDPHAGVPGLPDWKCIPTPGHTPGHISYFRPSDRVVITGDAVVTIKVNTLRGILHRERGLSGPPWYTTSSRPAAEKSIAVVADLEPRVLATGHGSPMSGPDTARDLRAFAKQLTGQAGADRPVPFSVSDGQAIFRFGAGEPLLLMPYPHGLGMVGDPQVMGLITQLTDLDREVIAFDPPGAGQSTRPTRVDMPEMVGCAEESLAACGITEPVDVFGHSQGGVAALAFALDRPDRVRRLLLVDTSSGGPAFLRARGAIWNRSHPDFWKFVLLALLHLLVPRRATEMLMNNLIFRDSYVDRTRFTPAPVTVGDWLTSPRKRARWGRKVAWRIDYSRRLGNVQAPTLVTAGRFDPQMPPACAEELAHGIPNAQVVAFEHSGHYPFVEEPDAFRQAVGRFLRQGDAETREGQSQSVEEAR